MSQGEKIGSALAKAIKGTTTKMKDDAPATRMYRTNIKNVPKVEGLKREDGWIDMQVQFLIDKKSAGVDNVIGWTVLKPGASHDNYAAAGTVRAEQPVYEKDKRGTFQSRKARSPAFRR